MSDSVFNRVGIRQAYHLLTGLKIDAPPRGKRVRVHCPSAMHQDEHPSCDLDVVSDIWKCRSCNACGGVADMVIVAGRARNPAQAARWLEETLPISRAGADGKAPHTVAQHEYRDENRALLCVVERRKPKSFVQKAPDGKGGWRYSLDGIRRTPYRFPELCEAIRRGDTIFVVEGEKDVDRLEESGLCATTNRNGAAWKWPQTWSTFFKGASRIVVITDCDKAGRNAAEHRAGIIATVCGDVRMLDLAPQRSDGFDVSDWLDEGHRIDELLALCDSVSRVAPPAIALNGQSSAYAPGEFVRASQLVAEKAEAIQYVVDELIPIDGTAIFAGRPKAGKSTTALELGLNVARGTSWLGRGTRQGPVLYLALEGSRGYWREMMRNLGVTADDELYIFVGRAPEDAIDWLRVAIERHKPVLVIVDTMQRWLRVRDGNDYAVGSNAMDSVIELARQTNAALMLLHHSGKTARQALVDEVMGSTAWAGAPDVVLVLRRRNDQRTLASEGRIGTDLAETVITLDAATHRVSSAGTKAEADLRDMQARVIDAVKELAPDRPDATPNEYPDTTTILDAIEGRRLLKLDALKAAVETGELTVKSGSGTRGDAYRYGFGSGTLFNTREPQNRITNEGGTAGEIRPEFGSRNPPDLTALGTAFLESGTEALASPMMANESDKEAG